MYTPESCAFNFYLMSLVNQAIRYWYNISNFIQFIKGIETDLGVLIYMCRERTLQYVLIEVASFLNGNTHHTRF